MTAPLRIVDITHDAELRDRALLDFPRRLYRTDPSWVPPLDAWVRHRLQPSNPFFRYATLRIFAALRGTEVVGTISALLDPRFIEHRDEKTGFFGFFECIEDPVVARTLVERATEEARGWGLETLRGPRGLTRVEDVGLTVEGFATRPPFLAQHHPRYYAPMLEDLGFTKHHDVLAYEIDLYDAQGRAKPLPEPLASKAAACDIDGLQIRRVRYRSLNADLTLAHTCFNEAYRTVPETDPMPRADFVSLGTAFLAIAPRDLLQIATVHGAPAGFTVCVPEPNEALIRANGRAFPLGWARALRGLRDVRTASFKLIGVMPKLRGTGLHARMIQAVYEGVRRAGYTRIDGSLIDERNKPMRAVVEHAGLEIYRRYRFYDWTV